MSHTQFPAPLQLPFAAPTLQSPSALQPHDVAPPPLPHSSIPPCFLQSLSHPPQEVELFDTVRSHPSSFMGGDGALQLPNPGSHVESHRPFVQLRDATCSVLHVRLHAPQLKTSVFVSASQPSDAVELQSLYPPVQAEIAHALAVHVAVAFARLHALAQLPQFATSEVVSVQALLQHTIGAEHATPGIHCPLESHTSPVCPLHRVLPGSQTPAQVPPTQAYTHGGPGCQFPLASQLCVVLPSHCVLPGVQTPVHDAAAQTYWHFSVVIHELPEQVCTNVPLHCLVPSAQESTHAPALHRTGHGVEPCHTPFPSHVCGTPSLHCTAPGWQAPWQVPLTQR